MLKTPKVNFHYPHHSLSDGRPLFLLLLTSHVTAGVLVIGPQLASSIGGCTAVQIYCDKQNAAFDLKNCLKDNHREEGQRSEIWDSSHTDKYHFSTFILPW